MKINSFTVIYLFLPLLLFIVGCEKENQQTLSLDVCSSGLESKDGYIKLGEKLENPYSLKIMRQAYSSLASTFRSKSNVIETDSLVATHLYVRFLPKDSIENNRLIQDTILELFPYPLDYEIVETGSCYHDPSIADDKPTWLYTAVPYGYNFPSIKYEVLDECYIPEEEKSTKNSDDFLGQLEIEAYRLTGNSRFIEQSSGDRSKGLLPSLVQPKGRIQVINNATGTSFLQGVRQVKVRTNNFVRIGKGWTDNNGNYTIDEKYRTNVNYNIVFENSDGFSIWGNYAFFSPAIYDFGWHSKNGRSIDIYTNSVAWLWSTINNASYDYNRKCELLNIPRPPTDLRIWNMRVDGQWAGSCPMSRHIGLDIKTLMDFLVVSFSAISTQGWSLAISLCMPDVFILHDDNDTDTRTIYETVYHELAHASHYQQVGKVYWLKYIAHIVANRGYGDGDETLAGYAGVGEIWGNFFGADCGRHEYGFLRGFFEMEDWYHPGFYMRLHDRDGFSERELYNCLTSDINTINKLRDELIRRNPTRAAAINQRYEDMEY